MTSRRALPRTSPDAGSCDRERRARSLTDKRAVIIGDLTSRGDSPAAYRPIDEVLGVILIAAFDVHDAATVHVHEHGVVLEGRFGLVANPMLRVQEDAADTIVRVASELGMTPTARVRLGVRMLEGVAVLDTIQRRLSAQLDGEVPRPMTEAGGTVSP